MKYALITGANSGIGKEFAKLFHEKKYHLVLVGRNIQELEKVQNELKNKKLKIKIIIQDLKDSNAAEKIYKITKKDKIFIEVLVNNAGFGDFGPFESADLKKITDMLQVNIVALTQLTHFYLKDMVGFKTGKILNVSSVAAFLPGPLMAAYYASKAYVLHFSEAIAEELSDKGIVVSALCPGATKSNFQETAKMTHSKIVTSGGGMATSREVAEFGYKELMKGSVVAIHGLKNKLMILPARLMPRGIIAKTVKKVQEEK
ncbi:SDR family NAD(P)-dependent oxidoreductase [Patescibacteria group bacterium]